MKNKKDIERKLLEHLLSGKMATQRNFGDIIGTSRLAVYKRRLVQRGFPVQTHRGNFMGEQFGVYYL